jgi:hypothetical protein
MIAISSLRSADATDLLDREANAIFSQVEDQRSIGFFAASYRISQDQLEDTETQDVLKCRIKASSVSCFAFAQANRLLGGVEAACKELGVSKAAGTQALVFYALHRRPLAREEQWFYDLGAANLLKD